MHTKKNNTPDIGGIALKAAREGEKVPVAFKGMMTSDNVEFYDSIQQLHNIYLSNLIRPEDCNRLLIIRHFNKSADIYINDFQIMYSIRAKENIEKGSPVFKKDIADINEMKFPDVNIAENDQIIFLNRVGWKFGLYFDFHANTGFERENKKLNLVELYTELGILHRSLLFEKEYSILQNSVLFEKMINDGWFPFIQLLDKDYQELSTLYENEWYDKIDEWVSRFDATRISNITKYWWANKKYIDKKEIIEAGINAYLENSKSGFINSIHNLYTQIEGILRLEFFAEKNRKPTFKELSSFVRDKAIRNFSTPDSLGFSSHFYEYIDKYFFKNFDLSSGNIDLSRHTVSHGVAEVSDYNKSRALQAILLLDQIRFYIK
ncbi:MAG: hypothetical protein AB1521_00485 [Bacteroidota bacterium]